jgi:MoxR-like ATPase
MNDQATPQAELHSAVPVEIPMTAERFTTIARDIEDSVGRIIVGQRNLVRGVVVALLAGGNALLEGVPGLGKTLLIRTLADALDVAFSRIQFTPDLMPADIVGTHVIEDDPAGGRRFRFERGPVFANLVLADEINRATPKTQSALLEAMQEHSVTVGKLTHSLAEPFFVLATQNPLEMEGTYPLPEAQLDRFLLKLHVPFPAFDDLVAISDRTTGATTARAKQVADGATVRAMQDFARHVPIAPHVTEHAVRIVMATHPDGSYATAESAAFARYGAGPRGVQALVVGGKVRALLEGRFNVSADDLDALAAPALRHRIGLTFEARAEQVDSDSIVTAAVQRAREDLAAT